MNWYFNNRIALIFREIASISLNITVTSKWARWRLKSPASQLLTQPFIQAQIKENIKAPRHWPLWGEFTGDQWIPHTKGQLNAESVSIWWRHHENCPICENVSQHPYSQSNFEKYITTCIPLCSHHQRACWYLPRDLICASRPSAATCTARFRSHQ